MRPNTANLALVALYVQVYRLTHSALAVGLISVRRPLGRLSVTLRSLWEAEGAQTLEPATVAGTLGMAWRRFLA